MGTQSDPGLMQPFHTNTPQDEYVPVREIADEVGVCRMTVHRAIKNGDLKAHRTQPGRGHYRVKVVDRDAWYELIGFSKPNETSAVLPNDEAPASWGSGVSPTAAQGPAPTAA
jgi:excisionase family DNA binding protein